MRKSKLKRLEAEQRLGDWDGLTLTQKIDKVKRQPGKSRKQLARLLREQRRGVEK